MSSYRGPKCRIERRLEANLFGRKSNILLKKNTLPGMHSIKRKKSAYRLMLEAKQRCSYYYGGVKQSQLIKFLILAKKPKYINQTDHGLLGSMAGLLESRLDAVVRRLGFADTSGFSRQLISHKHIKVDGKTVNIRSFIVKPGMTISISEKASKFVRVAESLERAGKDLPSYLVRTSDFVGKLQKFPELESIPANESGLINFSLVLEYLSKHI